MQFIVYYSRCIVLHFQLLQLVRLTGWWSTFFGTRLNYKTTKYIRIKGILHSIELRMPRRTKYMKERNILGESHVYSYGTPSVVHIGRENGWANSLLSLKFATWWNPKHPSQISTRQCECNSISQLYFGTIRDVQTTDKWSIKQIYT